MSEIDIWFLKKWNQIYVWCWFRFYFKLLYISYSNTDTGIFKHICETLSFGIFNVPNKLKIYSEESVTFFVNCTLNDSLVFHRISASKLRTSKSLVWLLFQFCNQKRALKIWWLPCSLFFYWLFPLRLCTIMLSMQNWRSFILKLITGIAFSQHLLQLLRSSFCQTCIVYVY